MQELQNNKQGYESAEIKQIPRDWEIATLNQLSRKIIDIDHKMPKKTDVGIPFLSVGYLVKNESPFLELRKEDDSIEFISNEDFEYYSKRFDAEYGDLLYSRFGTIGIAKLVNTHEKIIASYSVVLIKPNKSLVNPLFLTYALNSSVLKKQAKLMTQGSSNQNLHLLHIRILKIPLPPLSEQQKIASILSKVDEAIQKTDQVIEQTQKLKKGLMHRLFTIGIGHDEFQEVIWHYGKTIVIPKAWKVVLLDEVAYRGTAHTPDVKKPEYYNGSIKWVSLADSHRLDNLYISETTKEISQKGIENSSAVKHPAGTVIMSRDAGVGKSSILKMEMAVSQHFITWRCREYLNNRFLYYLLQYLKPFFESIAVGTTIKTIGLPFFKKLSITLPPLNEQQQIASILVNMDLQIKKELEYYSKLEKLKKGLMQNLLPGKIRVKV